MITNPPRRILFVDDDPGELEWAKAALANYAGQWEIRGLTSGQQALDLLVTESFDVIVADLEMPEMSGAQLLEKIAQSFPKMIRFLRAGQDDKEAMAQASGNAHRMIPKPCEPPLLASILSTALTLDSWLPNERVKSLVSQMRTFRSLPTVYLEVMKALQSPTATAKTVGEIIKKDLAMTTRLLQVVNSAMFALQRRVTDPTDAVFLVGLDTVRSLVLSVHAYAQLDQVKPLYYSTEKLWRHSMAVARRAKQLALDVSNDEKLADESFTAGMFHDIGKLVLASQMADAYIGVLSLATKRRIPLAEVEAEVCGASHAETGAYLLGLWGLPVSVLEAIALHHAPSRSNCREFSPLTAVHLANVLEHEEQGEKDGFIRSRVDREYLKALELEQRFEEWRGGAENNAPGSRPSSTVSKPHSAAAVPAQKGNRERQAPQQSPFRISREAFATMVATSLVVVGGTWWLLQFDPTLPPEKVHARPALPSEVDTPIESRPRSASEEPVPASQAAPSTAPGPIEKPPETERGPARLQAIFFRESAPAAVIGGRTVHPGDIIDGRRVERIGRQSVTLVGPEGTLTLRLK